jgi:hypothetical protein
MLAEAGVSCWRSHLGGTARLVFQTKKAKQNINNKGRENFLVLFVCLIMD